MTDTVVAEVCIASIEPSTLEEAMSSEDCDKWTEAIKSEIESLMANKTWILVSRKSGMHIITNRWIFKKKFKANGDIEKFKARFIFIFYFILCNRSGPWYEYRTI